MARMRGRIAAAALLGLTAGSASAAGVPDAAGMFVNFGTSIGPLMKLVLTAAPIMGIVVMMGALFAATRIQEGKATTKQVLWGFLVAGLLFSMGPAIQAMTATLSLGGSDAANVLAGRYAVRSGPSHCGAVSSILGFVQFIGLVAFARGLLLLHKHGEGKDQGDGLGRGFTHLIGGSAAMNITTTAQILANSFGATAALSLLCIA